MSRAGAEAFVSSEPYLMISVTDPGSSPARLAEGDGRLALLRLAFHDVDRASQTEQTKGPVYFDAAMAEQVRAVVLEHLDRVVQIVCHCEAGISRSAALAAAITTALGGDDADYFRRAIPNRWVYRTTLAAWGIEDPV
jgi:predicted protein tyrosine phosphatase